MSIEERMQKLMQDSFHDIPGHPPRVVPGLGDITGETGLLRDLHEKAMDFAQEAYSLEKRLGESHLTAKYFHTAFYFELTSSLHVDYQPAKSILSRSAASLALKVKLPKAIQLLVARGLEEGCPGDIANELREILATAQQQWPEAFTGNETGS